MCGLSPGGDAKAPEEARQGDGVHPLLSFAPTDTESIVMVRWGLVLLEASLGVSLGMQADSPKLSHSPNLERRKRAGKEGTAWVM